jgi:YbbR domain-containing protein
MILARLTNNWRIKLLALFLTASTWSVVVYAADPPDSRTIAAIQVDHGPPPAGLVLLREPDPVSIQIVGLRSGLLAFKIQSLRVSVDISAAHKGENRLPLKIDLSDRDVSIRNAPTQVVVGLDQVATVSKKVAVRLTGNPASCCVAGTPSAVPDSVSLTGPASLVQTAVVFATVDISGRQAPVQETQPVLMETPERKALPQVTANPPQVAATVPITNVKQKKNLVIFAVINGQPAPGYRIAAIDVPSDVVGEGDPDKLAGVTEVDTETIDVTGATGDIVKAVTLKPKAGISILTAGPFTVHIHIVIDNRVPPSPSPQPSPAPSPRPSP